LSVCLSFRPLRQRVELLLAAARGWRLDADYLGALLWLWRPVVEAALEGRLTHEEDELHGQMRSEVMRGCVAAVERYHDAFPLGQVRQGTAAAADNGGCPRAGGA
jgi:hypothetical protein